MAKFYCKKTLLFILKEHLGVSGLLRFKYFEDHSLENFELVHDAAEQIAQKLLYPLLIPMDRQEPQLINGNVKIHPQMHAIIKQFGANGWINATFPYQYGGQQLPITIHSAAAFIFQAANYSASVYPFLTSGAANLIMTFGSEALKNAFLPKMCDGSWQGTMALTEPDAGSSLSDISTAASPTDNPNIFNISGQKIFISAGDHDAAQNIVHLMLAKIKGGPAGAKGISLFVVPKYKIENDGNLAENNVNTTGLYHKMGYKGAPIAHLSMGEKGDCEGYLVGEPHQGLRYMFQMMNEARLGVGMNATAIATAAFMASKQYAVERKQGRKITEKDNSLPQTAIINHADIKRQLLFQKSVTEGSLALILYASMLADILHASTDVQEKTNAGLLLDFLTPIAKSYPSEMGCHSTSAAIQILGGAGYTTDFPLEQYYREARIHPIHEGTTGIHGLDLLGRKVSMQGGIAYQLFQDKVKEAIDLVKHDTLNEWAEKLAKYQKIINDTTENLLAKAQNPAILLADATLYLEMMGIFTIAWQWLLLAHKASQLLGGNTYSSDFLNGKIVTMKYFFEYELIKIQYLSQRLLSEQNITVDADNQWIVE